MFKRLALGIVLIIGALGISFIGLDILDIAEDFRIHLPTPMLNTVFFAAVVAPAAYVAARSFAITSSLPVLGLGGGALAFGAGMLLRGWLADRGLNVPITIHDSAALIASMLHLAGASLGMFRLPVPNSDFRRKPIVAFFYYLVVLASIALVTLLAFRGVIPPFVMPTESTALRKVVQLTATAFFLASAAIYLRAYYRSRTDFLYWYSLGLMLFTLGLIFMAQGAVDSRIAWLGRASQYAGGVYFLVSVLGAYRTGLLTIITKF